MRGQAIILLLFVEVSADGSTYFVDYAAGDDSANGTTSETAWKRCPGDTSYTGAGALASGDTIYFKRGSTYSGQISTTVSNVTYTVTSWGTGDATIDGSGKDSCFSVLHSWIAIDGGMATNILLTGSSINHAAIWNYSNSAHLTNDTYSHLKIADVGDLSSEEGIGIKWGGSTTYGHNGNAVTFCVVSNCYSAAIKVSGNGTTNSTIASNLIVFSGSKPAERCQINLSSNAGQGVRASYVHDNIITNAAQSSNGINCNCADNHIYNNLIGWNGQSSMGVGIATDVNYNANFDGYTEIYGNTICANVEYAVRLGITTATNRFVRIYNNVLSNDVSYEIYGITSAGNGSSYNEIYNNTFSISPGGGIWLNTGGTGNAIQNNLIQCSTFGIRCGAGNTADYNLIYTSGSYSASWAGTSYSSRSAFTTATGQGANDIWGSDPLLNQDLTLQVTSPAIGAASVLPYFSVDKRGYSRGAAWDIGAYEYVPPSTSARWLPFFIGKKP